MAYNFLINFLENGFRVGFPPPWINGTNFLPGQCFAEYNELPGDISLVIGEYIEFLGFGQILNNSLNIEELCSIGARDVEARIDFLI